MEQQLIILIYGSIGVSIAMFITLLLQHYIEKQKIIRQNQYFKWRKKFHDNFIYIERTWGK